MFWASAHLVRVWSKCSIAAGGGWFGNGFSEVIEDHRSGHAVVSGHEYGVASVLVELVE
jgi:hypothetical protein